MLIVPNLQDSFFYQIIHSVERVTTGNGYEIILRCANDESLGEQNCLQKLLEGRVKGLILIAGEYSHANLDLLQIIKQRRPV